MKKQKHFLNIPFLIVIILVSVVNLYANDFEAMALSNDELPGYPTRVLLTWEEVTDFDGINIYRKGLSDPVYPELPVNDEPITRISDCDQINILIPEGSDEYEILSNMQWPRKKGEGITLITPPRLILKGDFDPCVLTTITPDQIIWEQLQLLARSSYRLSFVLGQGYLDESVVNGTNYHYEIRGLTGETETILKSNIRVTAGVHMPLPAPSNIQVEAGDSEILITWDNVSKATGYDVYRRISPAGTVQKVNEGPVMTVITNNLEGDYITAAYGFIDYRRWDENGVPITHEVDGIPIAGPANGTAYQYQIVAIDIMDLPGNFSGFSTAATPIDTTPPGLPGNLGVESSGTTLVISWSKVTKDIRGRMEMDGIAGYNIYRSDDQNDMNPTRINSSLIPHPLFGDITVVDSDPVIISYYGEKEFYYRIQCQDANGNIGVLSSAASGHTDDVYPPGMVINVKAEGHSEYIRTMWTPNSEPDMMTYEIYRALCHLGEWPDPREQEKLGLNGGDFALIGEISHWEAEEQANSYGQAYFDDYTIPAESPLCYAYWIKARDASQNLSGDWPYPSNAEKAEIVCQRLRDETPPPPPVVSALQARDNAIYLEWIAAPSQDLGAFHIYRSPNEDSGYSWVGGVTVEEPPTTPVYLTEPFKPATPPGCDEIPLVAHEGMNAGNWTDKDLLPKEIYWYKITSVDQNGNESELDESVPYSTFTFKLDGPPQPMITSVSAASDTSGLQIEWNPPYKASKHTGFMVFRSNKSDGIYRQISPIVQGNVFIDKSLNRTQTYWYTVQALDPKGRTSNISTAVSGKLD